MVKFYSQSRQTGVEELNEQSSDLVCVGCRVHLDVDVELSPETRQLGRRQSATVSCERAVVSRNLELSFHPQLLRRQYRL